MLALALVWQSRQRVLPDAWAEAYTKLIRGDFEKENGVYELSRMIVDDDEFDEPPPLAVANALRVMDFVEAGWYYKPN